MLRINGEYKLENSYLFEHVYRNYERGDTVSRKEIFTEIQGMAYIGYGPTIDANGVGML